MCFTPFCEAHYIAESSFIEIDSTVCYVNIVAALGRARGETLDLYESPDDEEPVRRLRRNGSKGRRCEKSLRRRT